MSAPLRMPWVSADEQRLADGCVPLVENETNAVGAMWALVSSDEMNR
jgi:hypothetical protein